MKTIWDYNVSFPYGATTAPYTPSNPHKGDDRAAPKGTPVTVNGVTVGLVGTTGYSTGNHLHTGKWKNGKHYNPKGGGAAFNTAVVIETGQDSVNGKYVRINGDGYDWVYLHLSEIKVKKGQVLQDMYKGHSAKYWYEKAVHKSKVAKVWKARLDSLKAKLKSLIGVK